MLVPRRVVHQNSICGLETPSKVWHGTQKWRFGRWCSFFKRGDFQVPAISFKGRVCGPAPGLLFLITIPHLPGIINFCSLDGLGVVFLLSQFFSVKRCINFYTLNFSDLLRFMSPTPRGMHIETSNLTSPSHRGFPTTRDASSLSRIWGLKIALDLKSSRKITRKLLCFFCKTPSFFSVAKGGLEIITSKTLLNMLV